MPGDESDLEAERTDQQEVEPAGGGQTAPGLVQKFLQRIGFAAKKNGADNQGQGQSEGKTRSHFDILRAEIAKQRDEPKPIGFDTPPDDQPGLPSAESTNVPKTFDDEPRVPPTLIETSELSEEMLRISTMQTVDIEDPSELFESIQKEPPITEDIEPPETKSLDETEILLPESSRQQGEQGDTQLESSKIDANELKSIESGSPQAETSQAESPAAENPEPIEPPQPAVTHSPEVPTDDALADFERKRMEIESALKDNHPDGE